MRIFSNIAIALLSVAISTCACNKTGLDSAGDAASNAAPAQAPASNASQAQSPASHASGSPMQSSDIESPMPGQGSLISDKNSTMPFSGANAFAYLKAQTDIGTRVPGSAGSKATQELIADTLSEMGWSVRKQPFNAKTPLGDKNFTNIIASKGTGPAIVMGAHYDTKLFKDFTFLGANDGASGTALLMEMAGILAANPLKHRVEIVFFDGEESFGEWSDDDSLYGSRHYVSEAVKNKEDILAAIIVDMVGDKNLQITYDLNSHPELREMLFNKAEDMGVSQFKREQTMPVDDDHIPFLLAGIPAIDIIGFGYTENGIYPSYWHTAEDTIDKVRPESLEAAGKVLLAFIRDLDNMFQ